MIWFNYQNMYKPLYESLTSMCTIASNMVRGKFEFIRLGNYRKNGAAYLKLNEKQPLGISKNKDISGKAKKTSRCIIRRIIN